MHLSSQVPKFHLNFWNLFNHIKSCLFHSSHVIIILSSIKTFVIFINFLHSPSKKTFHQISPNIQILHLFVVYLHFFVCCCDYVSCLSVRVFKKLSYSFILHSNISLNTWCAHFISKKSMASNISKSKSNTKGKNKANTFIIAVENPFTLVSKKYSKDFELKHQTCLVVK